MSRKQASSFSSPGHRSVHFYFLCCVFNVCKLGRARQTIESVYNTHRDFDACFYGKKSAHYTRVNTVIQIDKMKASFKNERKKEQQVLLPCIEFPGFKKVTLESGIKSESLKREAAEQQLLNISYERQRQSQIRARIGA